MSARASWRAPRPRTTRWSWRTRACDNHNATRRHNIRPTHTHLCVCASMPSVVCVITGPIDRSDSRRRPGRKVYPRQIEGAVGRFRAWQEVGNRGHDGVKVPKAPLRAPNHEAGAESPQESNHGPASAAILSRIPAWTQFECANTIDCAEHFWPLHAYLGQFTAPTTGTIHINVVPK